MISICPSEFWTLRALNDLNVQTQSLWRHDTGDVLVSHAPFVCNVCVNALFSLFFFFFLSEHHPGAFL